MKVFFHSYHSDSLVGSLDWSNTGVANIANRSKNSEKKILIYLSAHLDIKAYYYRKPFKTYQVLDSKIFFKLLYLSQKLLFQELRVFCPRKVEKPTLKSSILQLLHGSFCIAENSLRCPEKKVQGSFKLFGVLFMYLYLCSNSIQKNLMQFVMSFETYR